MRFKKIVPIMKIKSLIESKSLFNPGFACFIQNLIFNDTPIPDDYETYNPLMKNYFLGTENKIVIQKFPEYFYNIQFSEAVYIVYLKSIAEHFIKIKTNNKQTNRGILLIGIIEKNKYNIYDKEEVKIFPEKYIIKPKSQGIFISYNEHDYVEKFLQGFERLIEESNISRFSSDKSNIVKKNNDPLKLDLILSDDPNRIAKDNIYRRSAIIDTINNSIFKVPNNFKHESKFFYSQPNEIIKENEEENKIESSAENKNLHFKKKNTKSDFKHFNSIKDAKINSENKIGNNTIKNFKSNESFENIRDDFCVEKGKRNYVVLKKMDQKFRKLNIDNQRIKYNNFIDMFLNKYDKKELINETIELKKGRSKSSNENESVIDKKIDKKRNKNPFSNAKLRYFNEFDDYSNKNEKRKKAKNCNTKIYSKTNLEKRIDSSNEKKKFKRFGNYK